MNLVKKQCLWTQDCIPCKQNLQMKLHEASFTILFVRMFMFLLYCTACSSGRPDCANNGAVTACGLRNGATLDYEESVCACERLYDGAGTLYLPTNSRTNSDCFINIETDNSEVGPFLRIRALQGTNARQQPTHFSNWNSSDLANESCVSVDIRTGKWQTLPCTSRTSLLVCLDTTRKKNSWRSVKLMITMLFFVCLFECDAVQIVALWVLNQGARNVIGVMVSRYIALMRTLARGIDRGSPLLPEKTRVHAKLYSPGLGSSVH